MNSLHLLPGCRVERINQVDPTTLHLEAHGVRGGARCPDCGVWSEAGHGSYQRHPADLPLLGKVVQIVLRVRRFCCHNVTCARHTFTERLPLGGAAGARLLPRLAAFTRWMRKAANGGVQALETFAAGLQQDAASVRAALTTGWSNGQTEGHVNKLKLLKRQMYGRAKFDLLRRRLLLTS